MPLPLNPTRKKGVRTGLLAGHQEATAHDVKLAVKQARGCAVNLVRPRHVLGEDGRHDARHVAQQCVDARDHRHGLCVVGDGAAGVKARGGHGPVSRMRAQRAPLLARRCVRSRTPKLVTKSDVWPRYSLTDVNAAWKFSKKPRYVAFCADAIAAVAASAATVVARRAMLRKRR